MGFLSVLPSVLALAVSLARSASADTFSAGGLTFSDELGGFRLMSVGGSGTASDPIVIVEDILGLGEVVLVIRGQERTPADGTEIGPPAFLSIAVTKIVRNRSGRAWAGFALELREALARPSPYGDGLSFDQMRSFDRAPGSDAFAAWLKADEPHDRLRFSDGAVDPETTVRLAFQITDPTPAGVFYLLQQPHYPISRAPAGGRRHAAARAR